MKKGNKSGKNAPEQPKNEGHPAEVVICSNEEYNKDLKERLEENKKSKLIKYEELINIAPDFAMWLKTIIRYGNVDSQVLIYWHINYPGKDDGNHFTVNFFTEDHQYSIYGYESSTRSPKGYLGCGAVTRKPRPGEDWNRGNDLPDGKYCKETFNMIVRAILAYEIKNLQLWRK